MARLEKFSMYAKERAASGALVPYTGVLTVLLINRANNLTLFLLVNLCGLALLDYYINGVISICYLQVLEILVSLLTLLQEGTWLTSEHFTWNMTSFCSVSCYTIDPYLSCFFMLTRCIFIVLLFAN
jgi:hypothetical protein